MKQLLPMGRAAFILVQFNGSNLGNYGLAFGKIEN